MTRMRKCPTGREALAIKDPIRAALTVCVDLCQSGDIHAVIGRLNLTTRRYTFTQPQVFQAEPLWVNPLEMGLIRVANIHHYDVCEAPF